ncbi:alkaline phosphatase family protein [Streptomyces zagrosensis]|uniref:Putative AlkP superfamily pyrophosphatase or phosphodiesterase n=1 Tax=Streptomyces zagrosensis TaxID=1042984 RepID=A0A7W9QIB7_9ACTN|nr:nucleotide pyrophosphatase/phosphodiesterase family protein [Streptomyces zagrosensis]MBB5939747.1 putative AlkP superfamily pyrophosphatase or phosphodiesterase [Streptomyces zagrosensis]
MTAAPRPQPLLVLNVAGLTPRALRHMPALRALACDTGHGAAPAARLDPVFPALTCSVQASLVTGLAPSQHGIVGNGWYFRELGEVLLWRQHSRLIQGEKVWETARRRHPDYRVANVCWWYAMGAGTDITVTPRPVYHADGRKSPDCYTTPPALHDELTRRLGPFPLFDYWGPRAGLTSTRWITDATAHILRTADPDLTLAYLPHLDYALQRHGPLGPQAVAAATELDATIAPLLALARERGRTVVVLSEYGITPVDHPVHINRALREAGLLSVYAQAGMEYLDPWTSRAFAVADHQVAHIYVADPHDVARVREVVTALTGVEHVLGPHDKAAHGIDHERAGELIAVAEPTSWFTYYYWLDDARAPDFARCVDIHRKPGYDPAELFLDPGDPLVRLRAAGALARRKLGLRSTLSVVPLDPGCVRGSHGRLPDTADDAPVLLCSEPITTPAARDRYAATDLPAILLALMDATEPRAGFARCTTRPQAHETTSPNG